MSISSLNRLWEQGSEFHWMEPFGHSEAQVPMHTGRVFFHSGRSALYTLLKLGQTTQGWQRIWVPTYSCPDVVSAIHQTGLSMVDYEDVPSAPTPLEVPEGRPGDVVLVVNFFGLRTADDYADFHLTGLPIIEDHTHDPWSDWAFGSSAMYCFTSLRKTIPIPDGAVLWSPTGASVPQIEVRNEVSTAACLKLQGMLLKSDYLQNGEPNKDTYLTLLRAGERAFSDPTPCGMSPIASTWFRNFPWQSWRQIRKRNHDILMEAVADFDLWQPLKPMHTTTVPFAFIGSLPDRNVRDALRSYLIAHSIYPSVLWPLDRNMYETISPTAVDFSTRMLSIHCDGRYDVADLERIATILTSFS